MTLRAAAARPAWLMWAAVWMLGGPLAWSSNADAQPLTPAVSQAPARAVAQATSPVAAQLWWPGFIDARGKAFLELPADTKLCALARDALRRAKLEPGHLALLPVKVETLLPRGARLTFGITDAASVSSERVLTRVVAIERGADKGACAHLAEPGADAPGYVVEEDRLAFGVYPPRPLHFRAAKTEWRSYGATGISSAGASVDARFAAAVETPPAWRARVAPLLPGASDIFGQPFEAVLEARRSAQALTLTGAFIAEGRGATYNTLNLIARDDVNQAALFQAGPSGGIVRDRAGSFVAQVAGVIDLDGDGVDEIVLRARHYSGGNLKILKFVHGKFILLRATAYEGE